MGDFFYYQFIHTSLWKIVKGKIRDFQSVSLYILLRSNIFLIYCDVLS